MLPATTRATSIIARPLCWPRSASTAAYASASASVPAAAAGAAAALTRRRTAAIARRRLSSSTTSPSTARRLLSSSSATAATATHTQNSSSANPNPEGLSALGTLFFGGLCAATLGLGCWQSVRYFEKVEQMAVREQELQAEPVELTRFTTAADSNGNSDGDNNGAGKQGPSTSFRRVTTSGTFDHDREMLVGPRGPPPGALSSTGPSSGRSSGGMSSSPQGYYVVTPLRIAAGVGDNDNNDSSNNTILVNRGWVPMSFGKQNAGTWSRPEGVVRVVGVETSTEQPKFLSPVHDKRTPNMLLWMDRVALEERTGTGMGTGTGTGGEEGQHHHPLLLTETETETATGRSSTDRNADGPLPVPVVVTTPIFPVRPTAETVGEFKVTPTMHAGYAVTWFGLSGAGMIMTRKLLTRGR